MKPIRAISMEVIRRQLYDKDPRSPAIREDTPGQRTVGEILRDLRNATYTPMSTDPYTPDFSDLSGTSVDPSTKDTKSTKDTNPTNNMGIRI